MTSTDPNTTPAPNRQRRAKIVVWVLLALVIVGGTIGYFVARGATTTPPQDANPSTGQESGQPTQ
ncbi:disulfide bond formation protein DsbA, partial [Citricoccus sp. NPDC079358]